MSPKGVLWVFSVFQCPQTTHPTLRSTSFPTLVAVQPRHSWASRSVLSGGLCLRACTSAHTRECVCVLARVRVRVAHTTLSSLLPSFVLSPWGY